MSTPINPKKQFNFRFLIGILLGFFMAYAFFYFQVTPFECAPCPNPTEPVVQLQCDVPKDMDTAAAFGIPVGQEQTQVLLDKYQRSPDFMAFNQTIGGRIGRANLQRLLNLMPADSQWVHFRYGIYDGSDAHGSTGRKLVVLLRNDIFSSVGTTAVAGGEPAFAQTIMNFGFCPIDCGNN
jgi:hypothetical protein